MKAISEIGIKKASRFFSFSVFQVIYHLLVDHFLYFSQVRIILFKILGARIGKDVVIMDVKFFNLHHRGFGGFKVGNECFLGDEVLIDLYDEVVLGYKVTLAQRVTVLTHLNVGYSDHPLQKYFPKKAQPVILKNNIFIGAGSIILPGVTIGEGSFVAAGSVVNSNIPKKSVFGGVPAKLIRKLE